MQAGYQFGHLRTRNAADTNPDEDNSYVQHGADLRRGDGKSVLQEAGMSGSSSISFYTECTGAQDAATAGSVEFYSDSGASSSLAFYSQTPDRPHAAAQPEQPSSSLSFFSQPANNPGTHMASTQQGQQASSPQASSMGLYSQMLNSSAGRDGDCAAPKREARGVSFAAAASGPSPQAQRPAKLAHMDTSLSLDSDSFISTTDEMREAAEAKDKATAAKPLSRANSNSFGGSACGSSFGRCNSASFGGNDRGVVLNERSRILKSQHTVNHLLAMKSGRVQDEDPVIFRKEVENVRQRVRSLRKRTLNPSSRKMRVWDLVVIFALLVTAIITPFEVGFYEPSLYSGHWNFAFNRFIDSIFIFDIVVNFFLPVRASPQKGGMMIYDNRQIALTYLKGWFVLDFLTCIPFEFIIAGFAAAAGQRVNVSLLRLLRVLRILKLMRIVRASRIINRWQDHIGLSFASMSLMQFSCLTLVLAHWLACLWGFMGVRNEEVWQGYGARQTWVQKAAVPNDANEYEMYSIALYVALNNIFGGSCEINPGTYSEFAVQGLMLLLGSSVWAYVIGSACGIIATLDPARVEFRQTMDELNYFCRDHMMPAELTVKLRSYFRNTMHLVRSKRYESLLQKMSVRLRGDAAYRMCEYRLRTVPFLVSPELEPEFMCNLAIKYRTCVYSRLERVPCADLFIVERGVIAKKGRLGLAGACFGKDVILSNDNLRDLGDAIALTFVQTISLSQGDIFELLPDYPKAFHTVRKAALRMALTRALVKAAGIIKRGNSTWSTSKMSITEIFDLAMQEAEDAAKAVKQQKAEEKQRVIPLSLSKAANILKGSFKQDKKPFGAMAALKPKGKWSTLTRLGETGLHRLSAASLHQTVNEGGSPPKGGSPIKADIGEFEKSAVIKAMTVEEEVKELNKRVLEQQKAMTSNHQRMVDRMGTLEKSMADFIVVMSTKLETSPGPVRQKRCNRSGGRRLNGSGASSGAGSGSSTSLAAIAASNAAAAAAANSTQAASAPAADTPRTAARLAERRELREEASIGSLPSVSSPYDA